MTVKLHLDDRVLTRGHASILPNGWVKTWDVQEDQLMRCQYWPPNELDQIVDTDNESVVSHAPPEANDE